jgi:hypothetical protein
LKEWLSRGYDGYVKEKLNINFDVTTVNGLPIHTSLGFPNSKHLYFWIWKFIVSKLSNNLAINIFSSGKKDGLNREDELYNKLIDKFKSDHLDFPKFTCTTEGSYFVQVLKYS